MPRKAGRGQPHAPPKSNEFAKCTPKLPSRYPLNWYRLAAIARPSLFDWDDRAVSRFSHPSLPYKILYLADEKETAFWEVFGADIEDMAVENRALSRKAQVEPRQWATFEVPTGLRLIDVTDEQTIHDLRANAGTFLAPYKHCQAWCRALMEHPQKLDGFIYQACRRGGAARCLALFSRPDGPTMESLLLAYTAPGRPSVASDSDFLDMLVRHDIDLR
jgi:hypothetical protein